MVRCTDRPRLEVRVSFEATRLAPQHLIEAYARSSPDDASHEGKAEAQRYSDFAGKDEDHDGGRR